LRFRYLVGAGQGILAHGTNAVGEVLRSVVGHPRSVPLMLEKIAVACGLANIYLTVRQNIWCWPVGVVMVSLYIYIFYETKLYSDAGLNVFFLVMQFYGWYAWTRGGVEHARSLSAVKRLTTRQWA